MGIIKKTILVLLTIFILGPLIFVGACFPIGLYSFSKCMESSCSTFQSALFPMGIVLGLILAIFVCSLIIKKINKR